MNIYDILILFDSYSYLAISTINVSGQYPVFFIPTTMYRVSFQTRMEYLIIQS